MCIQYMYLCVEFLITGRCLSRFIYMYMCLCGSVSVYIVISTVMCEECLRTGRYAACDWLAICGTVVHYVFVCGVSDDR